MIVSVFSFSYDKDVGATSTITIIQLSSLANLPVNPYNQILKILCVQASRKNGEFNFFDSNLPKK